MKTIQTILVISVATGAGYLLYTNYSKKYLGRKLLRLNGIEETPETLQKAIGDLSAKELRSEIKNWY